MTNPNPARQGNREHNAHIHLSPHPLSLSLSLTHTHTHTHTHTGRTLLAFTSSVERFPVNPRPRVRTCIPGVLLGVLLELVDVHDDVLQVGFDGSKRE